MALIDGEASDVEGRVIAEFAAAFEIDSYALADLQRLIDHNLGMLRIDITRRSFIGQRGLVGIETRSSPHAIERSKTRRAARSGAT